VIEKALGRKLAGIGKYGGGDFHVFLCLPEQYLKTEEFQADRDQNFDVVYGEGLRRRVPSQSEQDDSGWEHDVILQQIRDREGGSERQGRQRQRVGNHSPRRVVYP
jgi:hypothetical protein